MEWIHKPLHTLRVVHRRTNSKPDDRSNQLISGTASLRELAQEWIVWLVRRRPYGAIDIVDELHDQILTIMTWSSTLTLATMISGERSYRSAAGGYFYDGLGNHRLDHASGLNSSRAEGEPVFVIVEGEESEAKGTASVNSVPGTLHKNRTYVNNVVNIS